MALVNVILGDGPQILEYGCVTEIAVFRFLPSELVVKLRRYFCCVLSSCFNLGYGLFRSCDSEMRKEADNAVDYRIDEFSCGIRKRERDLRFYLVSVRV